MKMASFINQLKDLTPKSADIESTFIIRELKGKTPAPLSYEAVFDYFSLFFVSESEKNTMAASVEGVEPAVEAIMKLAALKDPLFEPVNLKRAVEMLREVPEPLTLNLNYATTISLWQEDFTQEFSPLMNSIPCLSDPKDRVRVNNELNAIFQRLLRNDYIAFNYKDLINEAQKNRMSDLAESISKGFLFKISLEDEIKKLSFEERRIRIPENKFRMSKEVAALVRVVKKGVDTAYDVNLRMVNWAIVVYAYIKWMNSIKQ
jgi:hypothetical protein